MHMAMGHLVVFSVYHGKNQRLARQATGPPQSGAGVEVGMLEVLWLYGFMVLWSYGFMVLWV